MPGPRWYVKKAARQGVALGSWVTGSLVARRLLADGPVARVLTYHRIADVPHDPFSVSPADFEAQMRLLADEGRGISLQQLMDFVAGRGTIPQDACLVTIDDGMLSTLSEALPILKRTGVPAVAYVSAGLIAADFQGMDERYLDWDELREVGDSGVIEIGSHAYNHKSLGAMPAGEAADEARRSRDLLREKLGRDIESFAYPFGTHGDFSAATDAALADAGYSIAFTSMHGPVRPGMNPISLPRVKVEGGEPLFVFSLISRGALDPWRLVDENLWRLQRVRQEVQG